MPLIEPWKYLRSLWVKKRRDWTRMMFINPSNTNHLKIIKSTHLNCLFLFVFLLLFIFCFPRLFVFFCCRCSCVCRRCWTIEHQIMYFICFDFIHRLVFPKLFKSEVLPLDNGSESYLKRLSVTLRRSLKLWFLNLRLNTCSQRNSFSVIDLDSHVLRFVYSFLGSIKGISQLM